MAKAERDAMKAVEDEENTKAILTPNVHVQPKDDLPGEIPPSQSKRSLLYQPSGSTQSHISMKSPPFRPRVKMEPQNDHSQDTLSYTPYDPFNLQIKSEAPFFPNQPKTPQSQVKMGRRTDHSLNPFSYSPSEPLHLPVKTELASGPPFNLFTPPPLHSQQDHHGLSPSEVALQEIVKLQVKQTELSALIAEQQRISSLPVQEPPTFGGSFFDYLIFMRAFEKIILEPGVGTQGTIVLFEQVYNRQGK